MRQTDADREMERQRILAYFKANPHASATTIVAALGISNNKSALVKQIIAEDGYHKRPSGAPAGPVAPVLLKEGVPIMTREEGRNIVLGLERVHRSNEKLSAQNEKQQQQMDQLINAIGHLEQTIREVFK